VNNEKQSATSPLAIQKTPAHTENSASPLLVNPDNDQKNNSVSKDLSIGKLEKRSSSKQSIAKSNVAEINESRLSLAEGTYNQPEADVAFSKFNERQLPAITDLPKVKLDLPGKKQEPDPVALMLARIDQREKEVQEEETKENKIKTEKLWTSLGFAAGSFSAVNSGVSARNTNSSIAMNSSIANQQAKAGGTSYTMGVNVGTKISERWIFQGGVNYLSQSSDYTAHNAVSTTNFTSFRPASIHELDKLNLEAPVESKVLVTTAPYNVNNNIRYLSIPMQAGFLVINKSFGLQLNAGVSTDLFLQNIVTSDAQNLDKTKQGTGENSPYRPVNLSGLMSTEFSYRFSRHYRIALNPGLRYPFNSIYKTSLNVNATPLTFDVGLRFRYIFH
jgi:hypothetical protein